MTKTNITHFKSIQEEAWESYVAARALAERTQSLEDGKTAARAYRRFLECYLTGEQRRVLGTT